MSHLAGIPDQAPTLEEWAAQVAASGRNYTDRPIGSTTGSKRAIDAELSAIVTETLGYTPPPKSRERALDPRRATKRPNGSIGTRNNTASLGGEMSDLIYTDADGVEIRLRVPWGDHSGNVPPPFIDFFVAPATRRFVYTDTALADREETGDE